MQKPSEGSYEDSGLEVSYMKGARSVPTTEQPVHQVDLEQVELEDGLNEACPMQEAAEPSGNKRCQRNALQRIGSSVSHTLETFFYNLGHGIASSPWTVILCCFLVSALCGLGMIKFEVKDSSAPIWIPVTSKVQANQLWTEKEFPLRARYNVILVTADNILSPAALREMSEIDTAVKQMVEYNNSQNDILEFNWTSICIPYGPGKCVSRSILELWEFDESRINKLKSSSEIINLLAYTERSPVFDDPFEGSDWLGDLTFNIDGGIINAKAAKLVYAIKATSGDELNTRIDAPDLLWETRFVSLAQRFGKREGGALKSVDVKAVRSFRDESDQSFEADVILLAAGIVIIICYVAIVMGKFNEVEHKVYLALVGVFGIGLAILVSYGLASALGQFYGPIHPILPFLLLGLGVDDMFVIIEAWNNLSTFEKQKPLPEKVAIAMKHAGVSITVTSVTDFVAFAIGASTALPALKSFCIYAALGILFLFIMQSTFFVAWLTIDQRRQNASRDACCIWIKYYNFVPNKCSQFQFLPWMLRKFLAPALTTTPIKVLVLTLVMCLLGVSSYGTYLLKTDSNLAWFLPTDSYLTRFFNRYDTYFGDGMLSDLYIGNVTYYNDTDRIEAMVNDIESSGYIIEGSLVNWHREYIAWLETREANNVAYYGLDLPWMYYGYPEKEQDYFTLLNVFVGKYERQYYPLLKWNDTNPNNTRRLEASKISFRIKDLESTDAKVKCLTFFENLTESHYGREAFVWSPGFRNWETNRVIGNELYTNLGLAFAAVFIVTLLLVANLRVCLLVCLSVIITLVNVCGMMHFWNLTIDILTSILLILSLGLAIDYSAHIGHTFMTVAGTRNERAKITVATMGSAIINGGFSTFLAFILLATSNSYVFITFFKVFFLVVVFGLFNGLGLLPVLLSWIGPEPYLTATHKSITSNMSITLKDLSGSKHAVDIDRLLAGKDRSVAIPNTTNQQKVELYIEGLPDRQELEGGERDGSQFDEESLQLFNRKPDNARGISTQEELDKMLSDLEQQVSGAATSSSTAGNVQPRQFNFTNHNDIIGDCERYLNRI